MSNSIILQFSNLEPGDKITVSKEEMSVIEKRKILFGEAFTFLDDDGNYFRGRLQKKKSEIYVIVIEKLRIPTESHIDIVLCQAIPEKERMELIIEKAVELGIRKIIPFESDKSVTLREREKKQKKSHKWPDIVLKAYKQCRRSEITEIAKCIKFDNIIDNIRGQKGKVILSNYGYSCSLKNALKRIKHFKEIYLMVGPEGGFSKREINAAKDIGFVVASAGGRVLRTETAAIAAMSVIQFELGDFN